MSTESTSFQNELTGVNPFYTRTDYVASTIRDFNATTTVPVTYTHNTESPIIRIAKDVLSIIIFPIGIYNLIHSLAGKLVILPASSPGIMGLPSNYDQEIRSYIHPEGEWKYKRITIQVDGYTIDGAIIGKASTLANGRWVLASNGNGEFYESMLDATHNFSRILTEINGNGIVFNYPGVGASSGLPNRQAMAKAYNAFLEFLEDQEKGIGAREIIGYGHSIGGGIQGDALENHIVKDSIKYVFIKSRTFSDLATTASQILKNKLFGFLVKIFGWNISSTHSSKALQVPEIIMQTAAVTDYTEMHNSIEILHDGVIPKAAALATQLLDDATCPRDRKLFIGMRERHNQDLLEPSYLARKITDFLR